LRSFILKQQKKIWSKTAKTPWGAETELAFQLRFDEVLRSTRAKRSDAGARVLASEAVLRNIDLNNITQLRKL